MTINKTTNKTATDTLEEAQQLTAEAVQDVCRGLPGSHGALIIGPSGQGKTHAVDTTARAEPLIVRNPHKGRVSAKGLYETLSEHSLSGHITILDDAEHDLNDDEALALLCGALWGDSTGKRTIGWTIGSSFARGGKKNAAVTSGASPPPAAPLTHPAVPYDGGIIIIA